MTVQCIFLFWTFGQTCDDLAQSEKWLVNINSFFRSQTRVTGLRRSLTASQVNQLKFARYYVVDWTVVDQVYFQRKNCVRARRLLIEIVAGDNFVLNTFVIKHNCMLCVVAAELKQIFDGKLIALSPPYFEPSLLQLLCGGPFYCLRVEQVKYFFVVNLEEGAVNLNCLCFALLGLFEYFSDCSHSQPNVTESCIRIHFSCTFVALCLLVLVSFHSVCFSWASLAICEDSCMVSLDYLIDEALYL